MKSTTILVTATSLLACAFPSPLGGQGVDQATSVTLHSMRDRYRPLLVFAPTDRDRNFLTQMHLVAAQTFELGQRQVILVPLVVQPGSKGWDVALGPSSIGTMPASEATAARKRFHIAPDDFTVILLGKDGGEKLRSHQPVAYKQLRDTIDAMPMRQNEMRHLQQGGER